MLPRVLQPPEFTGEIARGRIARRLDPRVVRQHQRVVQEERLRLMLLNVVLHEVRHHIRPELPFGIGQQFGVVIKDRVPIARALRAGRRHTVDPHAEMPEQVFLETEMERRLEVTFGQLPFADDGGLVARVAQHVAEGFLTEPEFAEAGVVAEVVLPRHQGDARRRAERMRVSILETHPVCRQAINVRRFIRCPTVGGDGFITLIVGHDQNDVGPRRRLLSCAGLCRHRAGSQAQTAEQQQGHELSHSAHSLSVVEFSSSEHHHPAR